jgi:hypothetical protein
VQNLLSFEASAVQRRCDTLTLQVMQSHQTGGGQTASLRKQQYTIGKFIGRFLGRFLDRHPVMGAWRTNSERNFDIHRLGTL